MDGIELTNKREASFTESGNSPQRKTNIQDGRSSLRSNQINFVHFNIRGLIFNLYPLQAFFTLFKPDVCLQETGRTKFARL